MKNLKTRPDLVIVHRCAMYGCNVLPSGDAMIKFAWIWYAAQRLSFSLMFAGSQSTASAARAATSVPPSCTDDLFAVPDPLTADCAVYPRSAVSTTTAPISFEARITLLR